MKNDDYKHLPQTNPRHLMATKGLNSETLLKSGKLVPAPKALKAIAQLLNQNGFAAIERENHLALLYPAEYKWLQQNAECGYLWREEKDWCWAVHSSRWWCLFGASNEGVADYNKLLAAIDRAIASYEAHPLTYP